MTIEVVRNDYLKFLGYFLNKEDFFMSKIYETKDTTEKIFLVKVVLNNKINVEIELTEFRDI